jgi:hypothetical protein
MNSGFDVRTVEQKWSMYDTIKYKRAHITQSNIEVIQQRYAEKGAKKPKGSRNSVNLRDLSKYAR